MGSNGLLWLNRRVDMCGTLRCIRAKWPKQSRNTQKVVLRLMAPLKGKGYRVFTNNFYSSPDLFLTLVDKNIHACGTVATLL